MAHPLEAVQVLQENDRKIARLQREVKDIPLRKKEIETQLDGARASLEAARENRKQITADLKQLEVEAASHEEKITRYKNQQMEAKTNEQYRALLHEVAAEKEAVSGLEDKEIELMEASEAAQQKISECESLVEEEVSGIQEEQEMLDERLGEIEEDLQRLTEKREQLSAHIDPSLIKRYERLFANKGDFAVVPVNGSNCGGCHMQITPQLVNDARNPAKLVACSYCGRMLINI